MADSAASTQSRPSRAASKKRRQATVSTETENKLARAARSARRLAQLSDAARDDSTLDLFPDDPTRATLEAMNIDIRQGTLHGFELPEVVLAAVGVIDAGDGALMDARVARRGMRVAKPEEPTPAPVSGLLSGLEMEPGFGVSAELPLTAAHEAAVEAALADAKPAGEVDAGEKGGKVAGVAGSTSVSEAGARSAALAQSASSPLSPSSAKRDTPVPLTPAMAAATVARSVTALRQAAESAAGKDAKDPSTATAASTATKPADVTPTQRFDATFGKAAAAAREGAVDAGAIGASSGTAAREGNVAANATANSNPNPSPNDSTAASANVHADVVGVKANAIANVVAGKGSDAVAGNNVGTLPGVKANTTIETTSGANAREKSGVTGGARAGGVNTGPVNGGPKVGAVDGTPAQQNAAATIGAGASTGQAALKSSAAVSTATASADAQPGISASLDAAASAQSNPAFAESWREARRAEAAAAALRAAPELDRARATAFADTVDALYGVIADQRRAADDHSRRMKWLLPVVVGALLGTVAIGITQTVLLMRLTRETTAQQQRIEQLMQSQQSAMTNLLDTHKALADAVAANAASASAASATPQQTAAAPVRAKRTTHAAQHAHKPKTGTH
nr:hypothetical protein HUO10_004409 [Paraburkholderia busanensis]